MAEHEITYREILAQYIRENDEQSLYQGQKFSYRLIEQGVSPEEVVHLHVTSLLQLYPNLEEELRRSFKFLLEVMIDYGMAYREHQSLKDKQKQLNMEIELAASMQKRLLSKEFPNIDCLDIGAISRPASRLNGDYYHFVCDEKEQVSVAIADVIGKGIPATLCMSMIRYAIDSLAQAGMDPNAVLENLNRVVERNIDDSMFITMFYGLYDSKKHRFFYSSAGHERGFFYRRKTDEVQDIVAKGLVLGVKEDAQYQNYERSLEEGDMIVLLTDGATECRVGDRFIERHEITDMIRKHAHLSAQQMVAEVYKELERMQKFELKDDVTLIIMRRIV